MKPSFVIFFTLFLGICLPAYAAPPLPTDEEQTEISIAGDTVTLDKVVISAERLPGEEEGINRIPTNVTVITSDEIEASGARTVPELLKKEAGFIIYDQVGNNSQLVVDLRGFTQGNATLVLVDGVRLNEPNDNFASFELVPPMEDIERIEIIRGGASTIYGEGAFAGVVNIITKKGISEKPTVTIGSSFGKFRTQQHHVTGSGVYRDFNYYVGFSRNLSDGFRDNSDYRESKLITKLGYDINEYSDINFSYEYVNNAFGHPGALTASELKQSRTQSPFNGVDGSETDLNVFTLNYNLSFLDEFDLSLNTFRREADIDVLTTGRVGHFFGSGFLTESRNDSTGFVSQITNDHDFLGHRNVVVAGFEYTRNDFGAEGFSTDLSGMKTFLSSHTETDQNTYGVFVEDSLNITDRLIVKAGVRFDSEHYDFDDRLFPSGNDSRTFDEVSPKVGVIYNFNDDLSVYANYSEGFLAPTIIQMFAFPGFGSNPDLDPAVSENYEIGARKRCGDLFDAQLSVFTMNIDGEILFDPTVGPFGTNVNRDTRREGVELSIGGRINEKIGWFANYTYIDATFESGLNRGKTVPLVPDNRFAAGIDVKLLECLTLSFDGLFVDEQVLDGDEANEFEELDDYTIFNMKLAFEKGDFTAYIAGRNIFSREYESRGIIATDYFGGFATVPFFTPAPPFTLMVGASYTF